MTPEEVIAQLRAIRAEIDDVTPLTQQQRTLLKRRLRRHPTPIVEASINVIGMHDILSQAIGQPLEDVRRMQNDTLRWDQVAHELRAFLSNIESTNLVRRQRLAFIAMQAYGIGTHLARDPSKAVLVPQVEEIKRMKGAARRTSARPAKTPDPADHPQRSE